MFIQHRPTKSQQLNYLTNIPFEFLFKGDFQRARRPRTVELRQSRSFYLRIFGWSSGKEWNFHKYQVFNRILFTEYLVFNTNHWIVFSSELLG